jgi:hypothetical protein
MGFLITSFKSTRGVRRGLDLYRALTQMAHDRWNIWTPEQDQRLRSLFEAGCSAVLVAAKLKRRVSATKQRTQMLGVSIKRKKHGEGVTAG